MTFIRLFHHAAEKSAGTLALAAMLSITLALSVLGAGQVQNFRKWIALMLAFLSAAGCVIACLRISCALCNTTPLHESEVHYVEKIRAIGYRVL